MKDSGRELLANLEEMARRKREERLRYYKPYPKQADFHKAGADHRERLFMAGNQLGKTWAGAMEMAMHLTGEYPADWEGRRFKTAIRAWAAGVTSESTRDNPQRLLLGNGNAHGTGAIPKRCIQQVRNARGFPDAVDTVYVKHVSGDLSMLGFKSYERGREKWQGETLHAIWFDEEPPADIYTEGLARISTTKGIVSTTFTPLLGGTEVVRRFLHEDSPDRHVVRMEIEECPHISDEEKERIVAGYAPHERDARAKGIPIMGSGLVYPVAEEAITVPAFEMPGYWPRICGLDFGWSHPTAAVWLAHDPEGDVVYVYDTYRAKEETPVVHAAALRAKSRWIPVAWPLDGLQTEKGSGTQLKQQYQSLGCKMLYKHAQWSDGSRSVEGGISAILQRMQTGRFKVFGHLRTWFDEFRMYHRTDGKIYKVDDDLMDATRYALMMLSDAVSNPDFVPSKNRYSPERLRRLRNKYRTWKSI